MTVVIKNNVFRCVTACMPVLGVEEVWLEDEGTQICI